MLETRKVHNNEICKTLFINLRPLYVTDMRYLEEYSGNECFVLFIVQWQISKQIR